MLTLFDRHGLVSSLGLVLAWLTTASEPGVCFADDLVTTEATLQATERAALRATCLSG